ncbi:Short-chain collagen C4 [Holothuria leucospilota]|uniref:Short-chain collagen C4 n=1 Tax=Holothuria leucospilota TaxID=206669 RepID=A0A9Q0YM63_HOLLE|nr:Short-chain collagen C4 [Holothuria leucospilota]
MELCHLIPFLLLMKRGSCEVSHLGRDGEKQIPQTFNDFLEGKQINDHPGKDVGQFTSDQVVEMISNLHKTVQELQKKLDEKEEVTRHRRDTGQGIPQGDCPTNGYVPPFYIGQCLQCPPGPPGPEGPPGSQGERGRDGRDGRDAQHQPEGIQNPLGNQSGAIYVRWGRTDCPSSSLLVYNGVAAGEDHANNGGGGNFLCLPQEPIFDQPVAGVDRLRGYIFGMEYETSTFQPYSHLHDTEVPCCVCRAISRQGLLMVPARNICPGPEWTMEYHGHLMTEYFGRNSRKEFICVDRNAVSVPGTSASVTASLLYPVESRCVSNGGLPCGPYVNGYELTCAVCTI